MNDYKWCSLHNRMLYCSYDCTKCDNAPYYCVTQFNYECPDCKGRFNSPAIPSVSSSLYYKCPFCGRIMEGM